MHNVLNPHPKQRSRREEDDQPNPQQKEKRKKSASVYTPVSTTASSISARKPPKPSSASNPDAAAYSAIPPSKEFVEIHTPNSLARHRKAVPMSSPFPTLIEGVSCAESAVVQTDAGCERFERVFEIAPVLGRRIVLLIDI